MIATLPMYDRPETRAANDRFYTLFRRRFPQAPEHLNRDAPHWLAPDLVLSQTCSLPYRAVLHADVNLVAAPIHRISCPTGYYFSVIIVRQDDPRKAIDEFATGKLVINSRQSQSGWAAIDQLARTLGFRFENITETGSHQASAQAISDGRADIAAIDAVSWQMIQRWDSFASNLRVLGETPPTPALPYITSIFNDIKAIQYALAEAVDTLAEEDKDTLCLDGIADIPAIHYLSLPITPAPACLSTETA